MLTSMLASDVESESRTWKDRQDEIEQEFIETCHWRYMGISVVVTEESYTSKIDHFALEEMKHQDAYLGKRVKRGLFQSSTNVLLNADVNGAVGIARKVFGNDFVFSLRSLLNRGVAFTPVRVNIT